MLLSVIARRLGAKFLLPGLAKLRYPVGKGIEAFLGQSGVQAAPAQIGAHAQRSLAPRRMIGHEILGEAPVVEQFFRAQGVEQRCDGSCIVALLDEFAA